MGIFYTEHAKDNSMQDKLQTIQSEISVLKLENLDFLGWCCTQISHFAWYSNYLSMSHRSEILHSLIFCILTSLRNLSVLVCDPDSDVQQCTDSFICVNEFCQLGRYSITALVQFVEFTPRFARIIQVNIVYWRALNI